MYVLYKVCIRHKLKNKWTNFVACYAGVMLLGGDRTKHGTMLKERLLLGRLWKREFHFFFTHFYSIFYSFFLFPNFCAVFSMSFSCAKLDFLVVVRKCHFLKINYDFARFCCHGHYYQLLWSKSIISYLIDDSAKHSYLVFFVWSIQAFTHAIHPTLLCCFKTAV